MKSFKKGKSEIQIDDKELQKNILNNIKQIAPTLLKTMEQEIDEQLNNALDEWPVKTGNSKQGLKIFAQVTTDGVSAGIRSDVPYVYYIKGKEQDGKSTWQELIVKPSREIAKKIATESAEDLKKLLGG